ncbi:unnamed protein product, partial [Fusarium fujikuroi]
RRSQSAMR